MQTKYETVTTVDSQTDLSLNDIIKLINYFQSQVKDSNLPAISTITDKLSFMSYIEKGPHIKPNLDDPIITLHVRQTTEESNNGN
jgi:hypothetical protein